MIILSKVRGKAEQRSEIYFKLVNGASSGSFDKEIYQNNRF
jgi:hypothetical protein